MEVHLIVLETYIKQLKLLRQEVAPEDIIMALFSQMKSDIIRKDHGAIQEAMFKLRETPGYKSFLEDFIFDTSGITPYSKLLEKVINRLETFSVFGTLNPSYDMYKLDKDYLLNAYEKFDTNKKDLLAGMGQELESLIA